MKTYLTRKKIGRLMLFVHDIFILLIFACMVRWLMPFILAMANYYFVTGELYYDASFQFTVIFLLLFCLIEFFRKAIFLSRRLVVFIRSIG